MQGNGTLVTADAGPEIELDGYPTLFRDLFVMFRARGVGREEAQDLAQETIVRTLVHLRRHGRTSEDLGPLVRTIGRNLFIERIRRARPDVVELSDTIVDDSPEPQELVVAGEQREQVQEALRSLTPRHRHAVQLWMQGLTPGQIARELGIKRNAADAILHRARRRLQAVLEQTRGAFGVIAFPLLHARHISRRIAEMVSRLDPSGALGATASGLAAVGIAVAVAAGGTSATVEPVRSGVSKPIVRTLAGTNASIGRTSQTARGTTSSVTTPTGAALATQEVATGADYDNPITGEPDKADVGIEYQPDGDQGPLDKTASASFGLLCDGMPGMCGR